MTASSRPQPAPLAEYLGDDPAEFSRNYARLRRRLILFFDCARCQDPRELADEVVARVLTCLEDRAEKAEIRDFNKFVYGIARHVRADHLTELKRAEQLRPPDLPPPRPPAPALHFVRCLKALDPDERELLEAYYLDDDREALAARAGLTMNALRIRICRIKRDLFERMREGSGRDREMERPISRRTGQGDQT